MSEGNPVLSNSVFSNAGLGIDLNDAAVTANDPGDLDSGPNNLQNFPDISSATKSSTTSTTTITGTLNSKPNQTYTIQCFVTETGGDSSAHGEGKTLLDTTTTMTGTDGNGSFTCDSPVPEAGQAVTATATNEASRDTSEFSLNRTIIASA
jgi:hypothetical protein